jgi:transposase-like protein
VNQVAEEGEEAFVGERASSERARIRELERRLAAVEEERDILKKAVAIFSRPKESGTHS